MYGKIQQMSETLLITYKKKHSCENVHNPIIRGTPAVLTLMTNLISGSRPTERLIIH